MPTYEYKCEKCGDFELWQSIKDNALQSCPKCGSKVERLISANVGFVFKGSGFYATDHRSPSGDSSRETKKENAHDHDHGHEHHDHSHAEESKPAAEKKKSTKSETSE